MISDENLKQLRAMIAELLETTLEAYGLKKPPSAAALRQQRYRERRRNAGVTGHNESVTPSPEKRNATITKRNAPSQQRNAGALNGEAVAFIPIVGGGEYGVSKTLLADLEAAYPAVDVPQTLKEIRVWCLANPTRCKTAKGAPRFINQWVQNEQNKG